MDHALVLTDQLRAGNRPVVSPATTDGDVATVKLIAEGFEAGNGSRL